MGPKRSVNPTLTVVVIVAVVNFVPIHSHARTVCVLWCQVRVIFSADHRPEELFGAMALSDYDKQHARVVIGDLDIKSVSFIRVSPGVVSFTSWERNHCTAELINFFYFITAEGSLELHTYYCIPQNVIYFQLSH